MKKERFEWIHSWCDENFNNDLPRVLLVGDSICFGYQEIVREMLKGVCYVDYVATSYAIDSEMYNSLVKNFVNSGDYDLIHFNHGLHGIHLEPNEYGEGLSKLINEIRVGKKFILATCTYIIEPETIAQEESWQFRSVQRNEVINEIAKKDGLVLNDLYELSKSIPVEFRNEDGVHYKPEGYRIFAKQIVEKIKTQI